jgi:hypothetical protein
VGFVGFVGIRLISGYGQPMDATSVGPSIAVISYHA